MLSGGDKEEKGKDLAPPSWQRKILALVFGGSSIVDFSDDSSADGSSTFANSEP